MGKFKNYTVEDFLNDKHFRSWITDSEINDPDLKKELANNIEVRQSFLTAKSFLLALDSVQDVPDKEQKIWSLEATNRRIEADQEERSIPRNYNRATYRWARFMAASLLLALGVFGWIYLQNGDKSIDQLQSSLPRFMEVPVERVNSTDKIIEVKLNDGSLVKLYPNSTIKYKSDFGKNERSAYLSGKGYFDIQKDSLHPFIIYSKDIIVKVLGTSFTVNTSHLATHSTVEVETGKVMVMTLEEFQGNSSSRANLVLTPNQRIEFNPVTKLLTKGLVTNPKVLSKDAKAIDFGFRNVRVDEIFKRLGKAYGVSILFQDEQFSKCSITVPLGDEPLFRKLDIICQTVGATYEVIGQDIIISGSNCNE